jgi:flagellar motility protein MotE (MotC chaperone)
MEQGDRRMDKDEMKNKISMALKDPILQQGFEIICKDLAISEHDREHNDYELTEVYKKVAELEKENAELRNLKDVADLIRLNNSSVVTMAQLNNNNVALRKENAELRKEWQEQVQKATDEGYARTLQTMQLTTAKEIIKELYEGLDKLYLSGLSAKQIAFIERLQDKAEQFISEVEK